METFSLHQLILHVVGGDHFEMLCIYNACMETFCLHEVILYDS